MRKNVPAIKGIIFDLGGVVVSNDIIEYVHSNAAKYYGADRKKVAEALEKIEKGRHKFNWNENKYWLKISKAIRSDKPPRLFWTEKYGEVTFPQKSVADLIRKLKAHYKTAVLSNTCQPHVDSNTKKGIFDLFDVKVFSCDPEINSEKPAMKIYKICLKKIGLKPEECVYIDDVKRYLVPARKLGMKAIRFKNAKQLKKDLARLGVRIK